MTISNLKKSQIQFQDDLDSERSKASPESRLVRWLGISDVKDGFIAYKKKDYPAALKAFGLGFLKLGTVSAACYGTYRWATGSVVHLNDFVTQAEKDFQSNKSSSSVPSSVIDLTESLYNEQKSYSRWPTTGKQFVNTHLESDAPMSSSILKYLLETAEKKGDSSLKREILKTCKKTDSSTEKSCLTAIEYLTGKSHPDALSNAVSIAIQCSKKVNPHCDKAIENGVILSIQEKSLSDVIALIGILSTRSGVQQHRAFAEEATALFEPHLNQLQKGVEDCQQAYEDLRLKDSWNNDPAPISWAPCYAHANFLENLEGFDRGHMNWWKQDYARKKTDALSDELKSSLGYDGNKLAQFCALMSGSSLCQTFAEEILEKLLISEQFQEAQQLMLKTGSALTVKVASILDRLEKQGKWDESVSFLLSYHKANPSVDLQPQAQGLWNKIIRSNKPYKAVQLLTLDMNLDIKKTLDLALKHHDDDQLHSIYLLAKSWIAKMDTKYDEQLKKYGEPLKQIIRGFFKIGSSSRHSYFYWDLNKDEMAKVLATKWALAKDPQSVDATQYSHRLNQMQGSQFDRYSDQIDEHNWEHKIS